jgi:hypothetical protein
LAPKPETPPSNPSIPQLPILRRSHQDIFLCRPGVQTSSETGCRSSKVWVALKMGFMEMMIIQWLEWDILKQETMISTPSL